MSEDRLMRLENTVIDHGNKLVELGVKMETVSEGIEKIQETLGKLSDTSSQGNLLQKSILVAAVVQALLNGLMTPDTAKHLIQTLFMGAAGGGN